MYNLEAKAKQCQTLVQVEVGKVIAEDEKKIVQLKAEMEQLVNEITNYRKQIEIEDIKMRNEEELPYYHCVFMDRTNVCTMHVLLWRLSQ
ncbi:hypothetical protein FH972_006371 [Carpinus fangiana]|uniref:Uncharacterized protein n=1 Tax=Carpinus fangiana TaxID=176857 RepID=A0A5N6QUI1_9ROSI|nr:hypothetical protein FH972_006371 [Carpinus fangiana]